MSVETLAAICVHPFIKVDIEAKKTPVAVKGRVLLVDQQGREPRFIEMPFAGHRVYQNPANRRRAIVLIKWGHRGAEIDLVDGTVAAEFGSTEDHTFFGHLTFRPDGTTYFTSENRKDDVGAIVERSAGDHRVLRVIPSYGMSPHEVKWDSRGRLWVANGGSFAPYRPNPPGAPAGFSTRPCVCVIDAGTGGLVHQAEFETPAGPTHMEFLADGSTLVVGGMRGKDSLLAIIDAEGRARMTPEIDLPQGPLLSIALEGGEAFTSNPVDGHVHVWDLDSGRRLSSVQIGMPTGLFRWKNGDLWIVDNHAREVRVRSNGTMTSLRLPLRDDEVFGSHFASVQVGL